MSDYPSPTLSVIKALERNGGWSRMFATSQETRDARDIIAREGDQDFWRVWVVARIEETFMADLEASVSLYRQTYGIDRPKDKLRADLTKALKKTWKPPMTAIRKEMAGLKRAKKEEFSWLRQTVSKR